MSRGRGKGLRGEGRISPFPAGPYPHSGRLFNQKKMPAAFSPSDAIHTVEIFFIWIKIFAHILRACRHAPTLGFIRYEICVPGYKFRTHINLVVIHSPSAPVGASLLARKAETKIKIQLRVYLSQRSPIGIDAR